ncbi:hypothetical protein D3C81_1219130 [compost metagenome]
MLNQECHEPLHGGFTGAGGDSDVRLIVEPFTTLAVEEMEAFAHPNPQDLLIACEADSLASEGADPVGGSHDHMGQFAE